MNRSPILVAALALALALPAFAQTATKFAPLPPPPGLNDPGVKPGEPDRSGQKPVDRPVTYDEAQDGKSTPATSDAQGVRSPVDLPAMQDHGAVDARGQQAPQVTVRQQGDDRVEEYRTGGRLFMVVVTPKNGVPQTYMADPDGKLHNDPKNGPVNPVYYKVYEWGAAPKPVDRN
ncbi:DUF2782 domain-containing protein [Luteibacter sp. ME-Dv--P-043b]|jgi:hypothetical protein|uniref:DUF2782 domain-containing protein n=1 Tax=Lysobacterales TaxID=135614 RepID=UPI002553BB0B|nr:DUF2782 domain-containing protein [Luteibacter sp. ME-Dv--P-043b]